MQSVGLQTVLQMSSAAERVQNVAQQQGALTAEQFKALMDKQSDLKKLEVQQVNPKEDTSIRDEDRGHKENQPPREEIAKEPSDAAERLSAEKAEEALPIGPNQQGRLLNIKV